MTPAESIHLADLRGQRCAPPLTQLQRQQLQEELRQCVAACEWCTIGVMAPNGQAAWAALQSFEQALDWPPFPTPRELAEVAGPVFLKGHQASAQVWIREEKGLGEGVLVSGHSTAHPDLQDTWGPFPLDFFPANPSLQPPLGDVGL